MKRTVKILSSVFALGLVACSSGDKTTGVTEEDNAIADGGSCSSVVTESSSSALQSSSSMVPSSSSAIVVPADLWDGPAGMSKINTKSDESGYWYTWEDNVDGGTSRLILPVEVGNEYSLDLLDPVIDYCGGLCAEIVFGNTSSPYAGVGFRVADEGKTEDITDWGGICVTYSSNTNFIMNLSSEYDNEAYFRSMPHVVLPHSMGASAPVIDKFMDSSTVVTWCASWHDFFTYDWDNPSDTLWGDVAAKKARAISFVFKGKAGEQAIFNIKALSYYDENLPQLNSPNMEQYNGLEVPNTDSLTCLWKGVDIGWVIEHYEFYENDYHYGPGNGAGYWFSYDDNNASRVKYPVYLSDDYYGIDMTDPVIEYCGGFCGTMDLVRDGSIDQAYAGIGFLVAGFEQETCENNTCYQNTIAGDIEKWGGLCITYFSEKDAYLMLAVDGVEKSDFPSVHLPKSNNMTERCFAWKDFDNMDLNRLKKVYVIDFEIRSDADRESVEFNVAALGKYSTSGSCDLGFTSVPYIPKSSSSSVKVSSSSVVPTSSSNFDDKCGFSELDDMWYGPSGETFINTGVAQKDNRGGTWIAYAGDSANVLFPKGTVYMNGDFSSVIDYCQGVCALVEDNGYGGFAFNIVGEKDGALQKADITDWDGFCVTYYSDFDLHVAFNSSETNEYSKVTSLPQVTLPQTLGQVSASCMSWTQVKTKLGDQVDLSKVSSILFYVYSKSYSAARMNILGLGKYHDITNSPKLKCSEPQRDWQLDF